MQSAVKIFSSKYNLVFLAIPLTKIQDNCQVNTHFPTLQQDKIYND